MRLSFLKRQPEALLAALAISAIEPAAAQNASSVSSADIKAGERAFEYRAAFSPEEEASPSALAHRLHYQQAMSDRLRFRIAALQSKSGADPLEFRWVRLEAMYQFLKSERSGLDSSVTLQLQIPEGDDGPGFVRSMWSTRIEPVEELDLRGALLFGAEYGEGARSGVTLESRLEATYEILNDIRIGAQSFHNLNTTEHVGDFDEQRHSAGGRRERQDHKRLFQCRRRIVRLDGPRSR